MTMWRSLLILLMAVTALSMAEDCIAPYHNGCNAQNPCCRNMMCTIAEGHDQGICTHWLGEEEGNSEYCKPGCEACCDEEKGAQFGGFTCVPLDEDRGMCMPWFDQENATDVAVSDKGCTPGCEACCHSSGSRYALHCVKRPGSDRGSCQHWLMEDEQLEDLKPGCLMAGEKGCKTSHDCCGVTGSLDGLYCYQKTGVCHPVLPNPYPLPPFSPLSSEKSEGATDTCKPGCEQCCDDAGFHKFGYACVTLDNMDANRGMCMPWFEGEKVSDLESDDGCTPGCEACCHSSGSRYEKHCVKRPGSDRGSCQHWLTEETKSDCVVLDGCQAASDCCNKGFMCAHFEGREAGRCMPWLEDNACVDGYGCQENSECCQMNYICLHSVGKEFGTCMPIMSSNDTETERESSDESQGNSEYCKPGCEACCDEDKANQFGGFHCMPLGENKGMCMPWFEAEQASDLETDDGCTPGCEACCHSSGSRYELHCVKPYWSDRGTCQHWLTEEEEVGAQTDKNTCVHGYGCKEAPECCQQHYQCLHSVGKEFGTCMPWLP